MYELIFVLLNISVLPAWFLLTVTPDWHVTRRVVHSGIYPLALGLVYVLGHVVAIFVGASAGEMNVRSIAGVMALFDHPNGVITGWTHYLVFDLFVGAWIGRDARRLGLSAVSVVPCLLATFVFGPVGLLAYFLVRIVQGHGISLLDSGQTGTGQE